MFLSVLQVVWLNFAVAVSIVISSSISWNIRVNSRFLNWFLGSCVFSFSMDSTLA